MTKVTSKLLTLMLSFAMVFTSIGWLGVSPVSADDAVDYVKLQANGNNAADWGGDNGIAYTAITADDFILDVRPDADWNAGHLPDATHVNVALTDTTQVSSDGYVVAESDLAKALDAAYEDSGEKRIVVICIKGQKLAARTLQYYNSLGEGKGLDPTAVVYLMGGKTSIPDLDCVPVDYKALQAKEDKTEWKSLGIESFEDDDFILDVRSEENWKKGHVACSTHVDVTVADEKQVKDGYVVAESDLAKALDAAYEASGEKRIVVICNSGNTLAARAMQYLNVKYYDGNGVDAAKVTYLTGGIGSVEDTVVTVDYIDAQANDKATWAAAGIESTEVTDDDFILDVRSEENFNKLHITGSMNADVTKVSGAIKTDPDPETESLEADITAALNSAYEAAEGRRIVIVCNSGNTLAARAMQYYNDWAFNSDAVDKDKVTYLINGAKNFTERSTGDEKARTMTTTIDMSDASKYAKGKVVRVWVPVPQTEEYQTISNEKFVAETAAVAKFTTKDGNKMLYLEWDKNAEPAGRKATLSFDAKRVEAGHSKLFHVEGTNAVVPEDVEPYITEKSEMVNITADVVKKYAAAAVDGLDEDADVLTKAKAIYDWELANLERIDNEETLTLANSNTHTYTVEGCGHGDTEQILSDFDQYGRAGGHCTDLNSVFVALCRVNGIAAREMFGIRMNDNASGAQHCWCEFYLPGTGWVYADPGDTLKSIKATKEMTIEEVAAAKETDAFAEKAAYFFGTVDNNRIVLTRGRDVEFEPATTGNWKCNAFGYPVGEYDGAKIEGFTVADSFAYSIACTEIKSSSEESSSKESSSSNTSAATTVTDGQTATVSGSSYKVVSASAKTVAFTKAKNKKSVVVPATVTINGVTLKVTEVGAKAFTGKKIRKVTIGANVSKIAKKAFKGSKATKMIVKTKALKKAGVKGSLKGSKMKTVKVKVGTKKVNKKFVKKYKKIFTKKVAGKKVKVK